MTSKDILVRAHALTGEYEVARGNYAIDSEGNSTHLRDGSAVAYCAIGFIQRAAIDVMGTTLCQEFAEAYETLKYTTKSMSLHIWNDFEATDDEIRDALGRAAGLVAV